MEIEDVKDTEKEKENFNNENIPTEEERERILTQFNNDLKYICPNKKIIFNLSKKASEIYYKYKDFIFPDILQEIYIEAERNKKLDFLYLIIEIIKYLHSNKLDNPIKNDLLLNIFPYVKAICKCFKYSFNDDFIKQLKNALNELKKNNIYPATIIDNLIMEMRLTTEPQITESENDRKCLSNLVNANMLKIDYEMINLYKDIEDLKRTDNNQLRLNLIKKENNMIEKQIKLYNENLKQVKILNDLIKICDNYQ